MSNVQKIESPCFLTTDGGRFLNQEDALKRQLEINVGAWMEEHGAYGKAEVRDIILGAGDLISALNVEITI